MFFFSDEICISVYRFFYPFLNLTSFLCYDCSVTMHFLKSFPQVLTLVNFLVVIHLILL